MALCCCHLQLSGGTSPEASYRSGVIADMHTYLRPFRPPKYSFVNLTRVFITLPMQTQVFLLTYLTAVTCGLSESVLRPQV